MANNLYKTSRWQKSRLLFLHANPLCTFCKQQGRVEAATVVDHVKPHRGDVDLFWDESNWQPLCTRCHASTKQRMESGSKVEIIGLDGWPVDSS